MKENDTIDIRALLKNKPKNRKKEEITSTIEHLEDIKFSKHTESSGRYEPLDLTPPNFEQFEENLPLL